MKKIFIIIVSIYFLTSCGNNKEDYQSSYYQNKEIKENCYEPSNPYSDGSGHYAGFERAEEKGRTCSGNSDSFINGCNEYYKQLNDYKNCNK